MVTPVVPPQGAQTIPGQEARGSTRAGGPAQSGAMPAGMVQAPPANEQEKQARRNGWQKFFEGMRQQLQDPVNNAKWNAFATGLMRDRQAGQSGTDHFSRAMDKSIHAGQSEEDRINEQRNKESGLAIAGDRNTVAREGITSRADTARAGREAQTAENEKDRKHAIELFTRGEAGRNKRQGLNLLLDVARLEQQFDLTTKELNQRTDQFNKTYNQRVKEFDESERRQFRTDQRRFDLQARELDQADAASVEARRAEEEMRKIAVAQMAVTMSENEQAVDKEIMDRAFEMEQENAAEAGRKMEVDNILWYASALKGEQDSVTPAGENDAAISGAMQIAQGNPAKVPALVERLNGQVDGLGDQFARQWEAQVPTSGFGGGRSGGGGAGGNMDAASAPQTVGVAGGPRGPGSVDPVRAAQASLSNAGRLLSELDSNVKLMGKTVSDKSDEYRSMLGELRLRLASLPAGDSEVRTRLKNTIQALATKIKER